MSEHPGIRLCGLPFLGRLAHVAEPASGSCALGPPSSVCTSGSQASRYRGRCSGVRGAAHTAGLHLCGGESDRARRPPLLCEIWLVLQIAGARGRGVVRNGRRLRRPSLGPLHAGDDEPGRFRVVTAACNSALAPALRSSGAAVCDAPLSQSQTIRGRWHQESCGPDIPLPPSADVLSIGPPASANARA